jgi:methyl-accepting chemotaxis protein
MSPSRLSRTSLKVRLFIPNLLYVLLLAVVLGLFYYSDSRMTQLENGQNASMELAGKVRQVALAVKGYLAKEMSLQDLEKQFKGLQNSMAGTPMAAEYDTLWKNITRFSQLAAANEKIESQINELASSSIGQSNGYIKMVAEKLADDETRAQVSKLERLVIIGANINTTSNYDLKVKFLQLKESLAVKQDILGFIDNITKNTEKDIKSLANTPFAKMAVAAQEANVKVKELTLSYIKNAEEQKAIGRSILQDMEKSMAAIEASTMKNSQSFFGQTKGSFQLVVLTILVIAIIGMAIGFMQSRSVSRALSRIAQGLSQVASGAARASDQVSQASQSLAQTTSEQAASIEETSSSMEEMASMTRQNSDNADQADSMMKQASTIIIKANDSMTELRVSMEQINKASDETAKIIKTIDEIAFQTNLLALNAAVEAARAGEAGAGFAVVADEVRNLAMRAAEAAKGTSSLIDGNIKDIKEGSEKMATTDDDFDKVQDSAAKVAELVGEIAAASTEQAQGIDQINLTLTSMDKVTQQNAANAEQSAAASEELRSQAQSVESLTQELTALLNGASKASAASVQNTQLQLEEPAGGEDDFS